jgi:hypothetical protein
MFLGDVQFFSLGQDEERDARDERLKTRDFWLLHINYNYKNKGKSAVDDI